MTTPVHRACELQRITEAVIEARELLAGARDKATAIEAPELSEALGRAVLDTDSVLVRAAEGAK